MHPILFHIRSTPIYSYGFFVALGVLAVFLLADRRAARFGIPQGIAVDLIFLLFVAGIAGGRMLYVWQNIEDYRHSLWKGFLIQEGGLVWYGGFIFAVAAGLVYVYWRRQSVLKLLDFFAPLVPLAHGIGRIGCFLNGCCYGRETNGPWGVIFYGDTVKRHPAQLYEALFLFALSALLFYLSSAKKREGELFIFYLLFYSAFRFFIEFWRGDQIVFGYFTLPQWTSLVLFAGASLLLFYIRKRSSFILK